MINRQPQRAGASPKARRSIAAQRQLGVSILAVPAAALAVALTGCVPGSGGTGVVPPPTTVTIWASQSWYSYGAAKCTARGLKWGVTPLAVQSGAGRSTPLTDSADPGEFAPSGDQCTVSHAFLNLQPGRWRVWVGQGSLVTGVCDADFQPGSATVRLSDGNCSVTP